MDVFQQMLKDRNSISAYSEPPGNQNIEKIIEQQHDRLLKYTISLEKGDLSIVAYQICRKSHRPLSQYIIDNPNFIKMLDFISSHKSEYEQNVRVINILSHLFSCDDVSIQNEKMIKIVLKIFAEYIYINDTYDMMNTILIESNKHEFYQQFLANCGLFDTIISSFKRGIESLASSQNKMKIYLINLLKIIELCIDIPSFQSIIFNPQFLTNFIIPPDKIPIEVRNKLWRMYYLSLNDSTVEFYQQILEFAVQNIQNLQEQCYEYAIMSIQFIKFWIGKNNQIINQIQLHRVFPDLLTHFPNHFHLLDAVEDYFYAGINDEEIASSVFELFPFFLQSCQSEFVSLRSFAIRIVVSVRNFATQNDFIMDLVKQCIEVNNPFWDTVAEIEQLSTAPPALFNPNDFPDSSYYK